MTQDITNTVSRFFAAVDNRDWTGAEALMTNPFHLDYSSFGAGEATDLSPADVLGGWKGLLPGFDHTHHQIGNFVVDVKGDQAQVDCYGTATHVIAEAEGGHLWTVVGTYRLTLERRETWRLTGTTFQFKYQDGNIGLPGLAAKRADLAGAGQ